MMDILNLLQCLQLASADMAPSNPVFGSDRHGEKVGSMKLSSLTIKLFAFSCQFLVNQEV